MQRPFRWESATTLVRLNLLIGTAVAEQAERPRWNAGDMLGEAFGAR